MATVTPLRGVRYNPLVIKDMSSVVTPPYDVIDPVSQKRYYEKHPYNIIRLELGYEYPTDNEQNNRYTRAAADYRRWLQENVLIQEKTPAIYLYEQVFAVDSKTYKRTGFFARVKLEDYQTGVIRPHEETLAKPKADRLQLLSTCLANFSAVFALYEKTDGSLEEQLEEIKQTAQPEIDITDEVGEMHRLWVITDPAFHKKLSSSLADKVLYIADGHHRYETALTFYRDVGEKLPGASYVLMYLVSTADPGLVILPTHRVIHNLPNFDISEFKEKLKEDFHIDELAVSSPTKLQEFLAEQQSRGETAFIMLLQQHPKAFLLVLKNKNKVKALMPERSEAWCSLDVSVLHVLILQQLLGIDAEKMSRQEHLNYTRSTEEAIHALNNGSAQLAFILNPTRIEQITAVASAGDKMPQKSTYFYPKLLTGLVINDLTI
ncbi:MAG: DUF1015 domain-containing protein [Thermacetogeniaceae bacterium]